LTGKFCKNETEFTALEEKTADALEMAKEAHEEGTAKKTTAALRFS